MERLQTIKLHTKEKIICPSCHKPLDGVTGNGKPKNEDISICIYCHEILMFTGKGMNLSLVKMSEAEKEDIKLNAPETWEKLMQYLDFVKQI